MKKEVHRTSWTRLDQLGQFGTTFGPKLSQIFQIIYFNKQIIQGKTYLGTKRRKESQVVQIDQWDRGVISLNILAFKKEVHGTSGTSWDTFCPLGQYLAPQM